MNGYLNKLLVIGAGLCLITAYQNVGRVQYTDIVRMDTGVENLIMVPESTVFEEVIPARPVAFCDIQPGIEKSMGTIKSNERIWLKTNWGEVLDQACGSSQFVGWSVFTEQDELIYSLEGHEQMNFAFPAPGRYTVIMSYLPLDGSGVAIKARSELLKQVEYSITVK